MVAAATGSSLVLATSATAFAVLKYAGAGYLLYLGVRMILSAPADPHLGVRISPPRTRRNSQFVAHNHGSVHWQFLLLGTIFVTLNTS